MKFANRTVPSFASIAANLSDANSQKGTEYPQKPALLPLTSGALWDNFPLRCTRPRSNLLAGEAPKMFGWVGLLYLLFLAGFLMFLASTARAQSLCANNGSANVTTWHNDNCRTGWQQNEKTLIAEGSGAISQSNFGPLWQYTGTTPMNQLYTSSAITIIGLYTPFTPPTIFNGRVYMGTTSEVDVFGLCPTGGCLN